MKRAAQAHENCQQPQFWEYQLPLFTMLSPEYLASA